MNSDMMDEALQQCLKLAEEALAAVLKDLGSPEDLLGKPYPQWDQEDVNLLLQVYGDELNQIIADREIRLVRQLEKQVTQYA